MFSTRTIESLKKELTTNHAALLGVILVTVLFFSAVFAPLIAPHNPNTQYTDNTNQPPYGFGSVEESTVLSDGEITTETVDNTGTLNHVLGTDANGRDILSRGLFGARTSFIVALLGMSISIFIGMSAGLLAGYYRGIIDTLIMRFVDILLAFPSILMALSLFGIFGSQTIEIPDPFVAIGLTSNMPKMIPIPGTITIAISSVLWVWIARVARAEAMSVKNEDYVTAAKVMGMNDIRIIRKHVLPNCITPILVMGTVQMATIIILESSLSFLGYSGTTLSLGYDIAQGRDYLGSSWWMSTIPGIFIVLAVVGINLIGDLFRDALDPDLQAGDKQ